MLTEINIKQYLLGVGQKWVDVTSERALDVVYTNNTEKPICVSVNCLFDDSLDSVIVYIDGIKINEADYGINNWTSNNFFIVPPFSNYKVTKSTTKIVKLWAELR